MTIKDDIRDQFPVFDVDLEVRAEERIASQFKESEKMVDTIRAYQGQISEIQDALLELMGDRWLENATGINLDYIGEWVGQDRISLSEILEVLTDELYRLFIATKIIVNRSKNTHPEIYQHISAILDRSDFYLESGRAVLNIYFITAKTPVLGFGDDDAPLGEGYLVNYLSSDFFTYSWTDSYGHEHDFFPIPLGVKRNEYVADGPIIGFGDNDAALSEGYLMYNLERRVSGPIIGFGPDDAPLTTGRLKSFY